MPGNIESEYSKEYNRLEKFGLDFFQINKRLVQIAEKNHVEQAKEIENKTGNYPFCDYFCGNCNTKLEEKDFFVEITDYFCTLYYKCPTCGKFNIIVH